MLTGFKILVPSITGITTNSASDGIAYTTPSRASRKLANRPVRNTR